MTGSQSGQLNALDWKFSAHIFLVVLVGSLLTVITGLLPQFNFGSYGPYLLPIISFLISLGVQWAKNNGYSIPPGTVLVQVPPAGIAPQTITPATPLTPSPVVPGVSPAATAPAAVPGNLGSASMDGTPLPRKIGGLCEFCGTMPCTHYPNS